MILIILLWISVWVCAIFIVFGIVKWAVAWWSAPDESAVKEWINKRLNNDKNE